MAKIDSKIYRVGMTVVMVCMCIAARPVQAQQASLRGEIVGIRIVGSTNMMRAAYRPSQDTRTPVQVDMTDTDYQVNIDRGQNGDMLVMVSY